MLILYYQVHNSGYVEQMNEIWQDCREFLLDGLQYEHLKPPSPGTDYLPLTVEVEDPLISEEPIRCIYYYIQLYATHKTNNKVS